MLFHSKTRLSTRLFTLST